MESEDVFEHIDEYPNNHDKSILIFGDDNEFYEINEISKLDHNKDEIKFNVNNDSNNYLNEESNTTSKKINFSNPGSTFLRILEYFQNEKELFKDNFNFEDVENFIKEYFDYKSQLKITIKPNNFKSEKNYNSPSLDLENNDEDLKLGN